MFFFCQVQQQEVGQWAKKETLLVLTSSCCVVGSCYFLGTPFQIRIRQGNTPFSSNSPTKPGMVLLLVTSMPVRLPIAIPQLITTFKVQSWFVPYSRKKIPEEVWLSK
jgi:hypothetical protein